MERGWPPGPEERVAFQGRGCRPSGTRWQVVPRIAAAFGRAVRREPGGVGSGERPRPVALGGGNDVLRAAGLAILMAPR